MKLSIANDHAGVDYKNAIIAFLQSQNHEIINHGTNDSESVDYPDFGHKVAFDLENQFVDFGIVICGSGNGINMTVNKHQKIRAALCWKTEIAILARQHNDANIISIPARFVSVNEAIKMVEAFINTAFEGGRHQNRVDKISC
jgi:ribose 5-phosphate isomerase B